MVDEEEEVDEDGGGLTHEAESGLGRRDGRNYKGTKPVAREGTGGRGEQEHEWWWTTGRRGGGL